MAKLRLDLDHLVIDSFDTSSTDRNKGTIFGEQCTCYTNCTCPGCPTCDQTCQGTCGESCGGSCPPNYSCWHSCGRSCWYTECGGNTIDAFTCNMSNDPVAECCPY